MKKFDKIYEQLSYLFEQTPVEVPQAAQTDAAMPPVATQAQQQEPQAQQMTSEGEAMLVRLLKKALVIAPDDTDADSINELPDINPGNAKQVLNQLVAFIRKYDPDVDLNK
jgi:hypothetical protein